MNEIPLLYRGADGWRRSGVVESAERAAVRVRIPACKPGWLVTIHSLAGPALARVRSADSGAAMCTLFDGNAAVGPGDAADCDGTEAGAFVGPALCGAAVNAWGLNAHAHSSRMVAALTPPALSPHDRIAIDRPMRTGVAAIDVFAPLGYGQRIALFAGAGVGKSTLLRRIAANASVDACVFALVGERGREIGETVDALERSSSWQTTTVVSAAAGTPPLERIAALQTASAQAEWLRRRGKDVLLVVDSLTRVAHALRELALSAGEPAAHRGYPPSVVAELSATAERAGARRDGTITAIYAVLVDGDDRNEPVSDAVRGMLDGHVVLDRSLADAGRFPPVDVLRSLSRLMPALAEPQARRDAALARRALDSLERAQDLFALGAYQPGGDAWLDAAVAVRRMLEALIHDGDGEPVEDALARLRDIAAILERAA